MRLTLADATESRRHPGRLQFDLLQLLGATEPARALGLMRRRVGGKVRSLTVVVDGTLAWIELWPAVENSPRVPLPLGEVVEVPRFRLDGHSDQVVRIVAARREAVRGEATREPCLGGSIVIQLFGGQRSVLRTEEQWVSVEVDLEPSTSSPVPRSAVPAAGGQGAAAD